MVRRQDTDTTVVVTFGTTKKIRFINRESQLRRGNYGKGPELYRDEGSIIEKCSFGFAKSFLNFPLRPYCLIVGKLSLQDGFEIGWRIGWGFDPFAVFPFVAADFAHVGTMHFLEDRLHVNP